MNSKRIRQYTLIALIVFLVLLFFLPIKIPFTIKAVARIYPEKEWKIMKDKSGSIYSLVKDYESGLTNDFTNYAFERGDIANIMLSSSVKSNKIISKGDTIVTISSMLLKEEINELKGKIEVEEALLKSSSTGERPEDINVIESELLLAKQKYMQEKRNYNRIKELHDKAAVSDELYENSENTDKIAEISVNILEMKLKAAKKGKKPEDLKLVKTNINSLKQQISLLERRQHIYSIVSPLTGIVNNSTDEAQILAIAGTKQLELKMAIEPAYKEYINGNSVLLIQNNNSFVEIENHGFKINDSVELINNRQVLILKTKLDNTDNELSPGMILKCKLKCEPISLYEYFSRTIKVLF